MTDSVLIATVDDVLTITWNEPDRLNALSAEMLNSAVAAIEQAPESTRLVVITGNGRAFSSGAALGTEYGGTATLEAANRLVRAITRSPLPVIAAVNGLAAGVGCSIAIAADITLARSAGYFLLAFVNIGLMPDGGATELVAASIGRTRANRLAMLGERLPADLAAEIGLIYKSVSDEEYDAELAMLVVKLGSGPTQALAAMKKVITANTPPRLDAALDAEFERQVGLLSTADAREGRMALLEKRPAAFKGT